MKKQSKSALLFDIDGTMAHTDPLHIQAFNDLMILNGLKTLSVEEYTSRIMGHSNAYIFQDFFPDRSDAERRALADAKEAGFRALVQSDIQPTPGLLALLDAAEAMGIAVAAVTNAPRANAELILSSIGITARFQTLVIGDELPRGKPDPLPYLRACEALQLEPSACVAFEDSRSGMLSASNAGTYAIGLMSFLGEAELISAGAKFGISDFTDQRIMALLEKMAA